MPAAEGGVDFELSTAIHCASIQEGRDMIQRLRTMIVDFLKLFVIYMPGETGQKIRRGYYKKRFKKCGKDLKIDEGVIISNPEWISVGDNVWIDRYALLMAGPIDYQNLTWKDRKNTSFLHREGELILGDNVHISPYCILQAHAGIFIGNNCGIGSGAKIFTVTVLFNDPADSSKIVYTTAQHANTYCRKGAVVLDENVGVGINSILWPGVTIEKNSSVLSMSIVVTSFPENSYIGGNPARNIKKRFGP